MKNWHIEAEAYTDNAVTDSDIYSAIVDALATLKASNSGIRIEVTR